MDKNLRRFAENVFPIFEKSIYNNNNLYRCWVCDKDLGDLNLNEEIKRKAPRAITGHYYVICKACSKKKGK